MLIHLSFPCYCYFRFPIIQFFHLIISTKTTTNNIEQCQQQQQKAQMMFGEDPIVL